MAMKERLAISSSGWLAIIVGLAALLGAFGLFGLINLHQDNPAPFALGGIGLIIGSILLFKGCFVIGPNEARVLTFVGKYVGTVRDAGLRFANPFTTKRSISLRARNFETAKIKVNDIEGNPIEIGAVVVWRVVDTALRNLAMHHPYDGHDENMVSLRGHSDEVSTLLRKEVNDKISQAGVEVVDARIAHLA